MNRDPSVPPTPSNTRRFGEDLSLFHAASRSLTLPSSLILLRHALSLTPPSLPPPPSPLQVLLTSGDQLGSAATFYQRAASPDHALLANQVRSASCAISLGLEKEAHACTISPPLSLTLTPPRFHLCSLLPAQEDGPHTTFRPSGPIRRAAAVGIARRREPRAVVPELRGGFRSDDATLDAGCG